MQELIRKRTAGDAAHFRTTVGKNPKILRKIGDFSPRSLWEQQNSLFFLEDGSMKRQGTCSMTMVWLRVVGGIMPGDAGAAKADFTFDEPRNLGQAISSS